MDTARVAHPKIAHKHDTSTRRHVVDTRFAALLAEDFGIKTDAILDALEGEPQRQAIAICAWAERTNDPAHTLVAWARKHSKGRRRVRTATERPDRRHAGRTERPGDDRRDDGRGSGPARRRGVSGGLDPSRIRENVARMRG